MEQELDALRSQFEEQQASLSSPAAIITNLNQAVTNTAGAQGAAGNPLVRLEFLNDSIESREADASIDRS